MKPRAVYVTRFIIGVSCVCAALSKAAAAAPTSLRITTPDASSHRASKKVSSSLRPTGRTLRSLASPPLPASQNVVCDTYLRYSAEVSAQLTAITLRGGDGAASTWASSSLEAPATSSSSSSTSSSSSGVMLVDDEEEPRDLARFDPQSNDPLRAKVSYFRRPLRSLVRAAGKLSSTTTKRRAELTARPTKKKKQRPLDFLSSTTTTMTRRKKKKNKHAPKNDESHPHPHHFVTPCGRMAHEFGHVLVESAANANNAPPRIDVTRLIRAAEHYTAEMRRIGQKQSASDMEKNVRKAKDLMRASPHPTQHDMRALLEHETSTGIHLPHGHISDPSGAVGLLWIRRSLSYQHRMFDLVLNHRASPPDAAAQAYRSELQPFHGWALQKLYTLAMSSMTPGTTEELLAKVGGYDIKDKHHQHRLDDDHRDHHHASSSSSSSSSHHHGGTTADAEASCRADLQRLLDAWDPLLRHWKHLYHELDLEDPRRY
jgi:Glycolipid transfer protein (GLTP)